MRRALLALLLLAGCGDDDPETAVIVRLNADATLRTAITRVELRVSGAGAGETLSQVHAGTVPTNADRWPLTTVIAPARDEPGRRFLYEAYGFDDDDVERGHIRVEASFVDGMQIPLDLTFVDGCDALGCGDQSCEAVGGEPRCVPPERDLLPATDGGVDDGGSDGGRDGSVDGGPTDAGMIPAPTLRWPPNGHYTGSPHAPRSAVDPLRPRLLWERLDGAASYRVEMVQCEPAETVSACGMRFDEEVPVVGDVTAGVPASDPMEWQPPRLSVTDGAGPVGARYVWRVTGCVELDRCEGPPSEIRYLNVGRVRGDLNGDGYGDIAAGDPTRVTLGEGGAVTLFHGGETLPDSLAKRELMGLEPLTFDSGVVLATGDFDGDGFADLAVGRTDEVELFWGGTDGPESKIVLNHASGTFGNSLASVGDLDGDGYDDLAIGYTATHQIFVVWGDESRGLLVGSPLDTVTPDLPSRALPFAAGDVDGDGLLDMIVGLPAGDEGTSVLFLGTSSRTLAGTRLEPMVSRSTDDFGAVAAHGDFDGDGFSDVAVGAPIGSSGTGRVYLFRGARGGPIGDAWEPIDGDVPGENFGAGLAAADADGDGDDELFVGSPNWTEDGAIGTGRIQGFSIDADDAPVSLSVVSAPPVESQRFGNMLSATDLDGDGSPELLVSAPGENFLHVWPLALAVSLQLTTAGGDPPFEFPAAIAP